MKKNIIIFVLFLISCQGRVPCDLGSHYYLDYDRNSYFSIFEMEKKNSDTRNIVIKGNILEINKDSTFIIALLKPVYKISDSIYKVERDINYEKMQRLIQMSSMKEYWIVNKKMKPELKLDKKGNYYVSNVFGPYTIEQFIKKRKELGVSDSLQLIPTKKFLYLE